jgi:hypothetical protein
MRVLTGLILFLSAFTLLAQDSLRSKSKSVITLAYLFPNPGRIMLKQDMQNQLADLANRGISNTSDIKYSVKGFGPIFFRSEHLLNEKFGLGPVFGYTRAYVTHQFVPSGTSGQGLTLQTNNFLEHRYGLQCFTFGLRNTFYVKKREKSETYFTVSLGYTHTVEEISDYYPARYFISIPELRNPWFSGGPDFLMDVYHPLYWAFTFGLREYLSRNAGIFAEFGIDKWSFVQLGFFIRSSK